MNSFPKKYYVITAVIDYDNFESDKDLILKFNFDSQEEYKLLYPYHMGWVYCENELFNEEFFF